MRGCIQQTGFGTASRTHMELAQKRHARLFLSCCANCCAMHSLHFTPRRALTTPRTACCAHRDFFFLFFLSFSFHLAPHSALRTARLAGRHSYYYQPLAPGGTPPQHHAAASLPPSPSPSPRAKMWWSVSSFPPRYRQQPQHQ